MDQRVYYGNLNPHALADYLVGVYHKPTFYYAQRHTVAQKIVQGERIYVQIMRTSDWSGSGHRAIGVNISRIAGGLQVEMGASDWLDIDEAGLAGMLLGALFFPPLLLFPLIQGLSSSGFSHDVWNTIDGYMQAGAHQGQRPHAPQGFYCTYCGAFNHPGAPRCHSCHAPFNFAPPQPPPAQPAAEPEAPPATDAPHKSGETRPMFALMICPNCKATVVPAHFCGNCAAPLPDVSEEKKAEE
jgi:hypothetical protein